MILSAFSRSPRHEGRSRPHFVMSAHEIIHTIDWHVDAARSVVAFYVAISTYCKFVSKIGSYVRLLFPFLLVFQLNLALFFSGEFTSESLYTLMTTLRQGCQMVYFQTKHPNLGNFLKGLHWKRLVYFMCIWSILQTFALSYGGLVYLLVIW
jgi:hypothetical protein